MPPFILRATKPFLKSATCYLTAVIAFQPAQAQSTEELAGKDETLRCS
jgi:hypothetical protein